MDLTKTLDASELNLNKTHHRAYIALEAAMLNEDRGSRLVNDLFGEVPSIITLLKEKVILGTGEERNPSEARARRIVSELQEMGVIGRPDEYARYHDPNNGTWFVRILTNLPREEECPATRRRARAHPVHTETSTRPSIRSSTSIEDQFVCIRSDLFDWLISRMSESELDAHTRNILYFRRFFRRHRHCLGCNSRKTSFPYSL